MLCVLGEQEVVSALQAGRRELLGCEEPGFVQAGLGWARLGKPQSSGLGAAAPRLQSSSPVWKCVELTGKVIKDHVWRIGRNRGAFMQSRSDTI